MSAGTHRDQPSVSGRLAWAALALVTAVVVFLVTNITQGACYDSGTDPAASYCTSGPMVGTAGVWVLWALWAVLAAFCVHRILRRRAI